MFHRWAATLLVLGVARAADAAEPPAAPPAAAPPADAAEPAAAAPAAAPAALAAEPAAEPPAVAPAALAAEPAAAHPAAAPAALAAEPAAEPRRALRAAHPVVAPLAGAATAFVPFVVGCALWSSDGRPDLQAAGTYVMVAGFAAAPWVSHGVQGRWRRAAAFGSISAATSAATLIAMQVKDPFDPNYVNRQRVPFGILMSSALFAAAIGVIDSFVASPAPQDP
jgi:hypothetical protein